MKLAIVTACPGGQVTSVLAARLLRGAAERLGWETCVEANAGSRPEGELSAEQIAEADWVLLVGVEPLAAARFVGKPVYRARPAEALADPRAFLQRAAALASVEVAGDEAGLVAPEAGAAPRIVAVTACPTGVAHTFMAAEALQLAAGQLGFALQVETQGSVGARNPLDPADIAAADVVLLAADIDVDTARFAGKKIYRCGTGVALKQARATLERALAEGQVESAGAASAVVARDEKRGVYKHLLTGVSFMLPMVVAGGLLIALSLAFGIDAYKQPGSLAAVLRTVGDTAFVLMVPVLAGYIAYSIADRPGLAPGMLGGLLAGTLGAGFIGGIVAGFIAGYAARAISHGLRLPASLEALKPILVIPLLASLVTGLLMLYVVGKPVAGMLAALTGFLDGMGTSNAILLGLLLGGMMCVDLGGPVNKAAYAFSVGLLSSHSYAPMAAVMAAGMVPPIGMGLATLLARRKFAESERQAGKAASVLGLCFISEGAIPFAAKDPLRVIPA
ncbi:PTS fructose-like transporter subunit IIB, partial [Pseudomonas aeruginosa]